MGGARALIASLGASFSLVAGAAVSLLLLSFVFALPGLAGGGDAPAASGPVLLESEPLPARASRGAPGPETSAAVLISAPERSRAAARPARRESAARREAAAGTPSFNPGVRDLSPPAPPAPATDTPPAAPDPALGDSVRDVGDIVTATVQGTGAAAGELTAPLLGPPVSKAIQDVLDLLAAVLQGATSALGGALDKTLPR